MRSAKEDVRALLDELPEDASLEQIQYHLYVREKINRGREDVAAGRVLSQEEIEHRVARWTGK